MVGAELERIEPLLQRIFATVDPHPSFRVVSLLTRTVRGRGQMWTQLDDVPSSVSVQEPSLVLSSSQLNVLAVGVYLSLNLAIPTLPLQVVALDDPLQSLDTVNLLGLADLLRRVKASRQVIVSTHDTNLAALLERKLRPVSPDQRTVRIDLNGWTLEDQPSSKAMYLRMQVHFAWSSAPSIRIAAQGGHTRLGPPISAESLRGSSSTDDTPNQPGSQIVPVKPGRVQLGHPVGLLGGPPPSLDPGSPTPAPIPPPPRPPTAACGCCETGAPGYRAWLSTVAAWALRRVLTWA